TNSGTGVVQANLINGAANAQLNFASSGTNSNINLTHGAVVFDAVGSGNVVNLNGATFTVNAYTPIAYRYGVTPGTEIMLDGHASKSRNTKKLADLFVRGCSGVKALPAEGANDKANSSDSARKGVTMSLRHGDMVMPPVTATTIHTVFGDI